MPNVIDPLSLRRFTRVPFQARVIFETEAAPRRCVLVDISLNGALVENGSALESAPGTPCRLEVPLDGEHVIRMAGRVAHATEGRLGIECIELDLESATTLRRLVALNSGDRGGLERDLAALVSAPPAG